MKAKLNGGYETVEQRLSLGRRRLEWVDSPGRRRKALKGVGLLAGTWSNPRCNKITLICRPDGL